MKTLITIFLCLNCFILSIVAQKNGLVNTSKSQYAKICNIDLDDVQWTNGFWADWFEVCKQSMVPHMMSNYLDDEVSHAFANFEIAAGLKKGEHKGPPFHDGDFYKMLEGLITIYSVTKDKKIEQQLDSIINIIGMTQRKDGYIHTPVVIKQLKNDSDKKEFAKRLDFETYNMGHLMTAACLHYRSTGKTNMLDIAIKATDFLYEFYLKNPAELAKNAICPSHYMGITEMYRTTLNPKYLELAKNLIAIRSMVKNGTDHNQDRIPFKKQTKAVGHAVRANYLYAGATDVYLETGDDSLFTALNAIWHDLTERKLYITGACGALYDGVSPDGTSYKPSFIQQVHQAYGRDYQLPNLTAHNESCANIGNLLWNWRMFLATGEARFTDIMEQIMYNSLLAGVSLDGKGYFYTNPLCVTSDITYTLRWSKEREEYISYCNCCPPNTIRTVAQIHNYMYSISDKGLWVNFYGGNKLNTTLKDGSVIKLVQKTDYPWNGNIILQMEQVPEKKFSVFLRIPGWCHNAISYINGKEHLVTSSGQYFEISKKWEKGDIIKLVLSMKVKLIEANPLIEETRNLVAIKRGPVVYCLEAVDLPDNCKIFDIIIPADINFSAKPTTINNQNIIGLKGEALVVKNENWNHQLYQELKRERETINITLIPYYAWGNRRKADMTVWLPVNRF